MLATFVAVALLAGPGATPAAKPAKAGWDANRVICKYDLQPGSRLARRKTCMIASEWAEYKRIEQLNLMIHQYNGAP